MLWLKIVPADAETSAADTITDAHGRKWRAEQTAEIGQVSDLLHIRRVFVQDVYFDWQSQEHPAADWEYGLRFHDGEGTSTLLLAIEGGEVCIAESGTQATLSPAIRRSLRLFFERFNHPQLPSKAAAK